jgi:uncharacterized protein (TIGR03083 family)
VHIDLAPARDAFCGELDELLELAGRLDEHDLLATSRCRGWTVGDVLVHVHLGLQEMLLGIVSPTSKSRTVDAASYWASAPPSNDDAAFGVGHVHYVRLLASAYRGPDALAKHLSLIGRTVRRAAARLPDGQLEFQGHVIATGDFLATWAVELAVHHLDLGAELTLPPPRAEAVRLARRTVEELAGGALPADLSDTEAVLIGTGRREAGDLEVAGLRLPALG